MAWSSQSDSSALTLSGSYQTVQQSAADMEIELNPGESLLLLLDYNPQASPTEYADVVISVSLDGATWSTDDRPLERRIISFDSDPTIDPVIVWGVRYVRVRARLLDTDLSTAGGTDTSSTLTVRYAKDGVSV